MVRRQFAEKANQVGPWIERQMDAVTAIGMGLQVRNLSLHCGNMLNESVGNNGQSVLWMSKKVVGIILVLSKGVITQWLCRYSLSKFL
jgi:hypothetical protein